MKIEGLVIGLVALFLAALFVAIISVQPKGRAYTEEDEFPDSYFIWSSGGFHNATEAEIEAVKKDLEKWRKSKK